MNPASQQLFQYAVGQVTAQDIFDFSPNDPGASGYVHDFTAILHSRILPEVYSFNLTETIGLTQWGEPEQETDPVRFRRFRLFTNAVGAAMCSGRKGPDDNLPPNYLAISLLDDAWALRDEQVLHLLASVFGEMHARVVTARWCAADAPFLLLGQLLLALGGYAQTDPALLAANLVEAERQRSLRKGKEVFLWGSTVFNQMHDRWQHHVQRTYASSEEPRDEILQAVRDGLTGGERPSLLAAE